ncbi:unnamed protein product, partial [Ectocarpus fasciculatus]
ASAATTPATASTAASGMHAKGATLRALWLTAAVATALSGPRSSASASSTAGASSSAFVGAAAATVAPLEPFHVRAPRWGARSSPSSSSSSSSMSMAFASAARETQRQQQKEDLLQRPYSSPVAAAVAPKSRLPLMGKALFVTGGAAGAGAAAAGEGEPAGFGLASAWGVVSVVFILMNAVKRLAPIAMQPFSR